MAHIERTRAVVETNETYDGTIIPSEQAEIDRPVRLREDATVRGSVYGATVEAAADAAIDGSIMAAESVELNSARVGQEVGTPGKIVATDSRVEGTVTGKRVRLVDCVVRGNVVGANIILENCVVLGIVTAKRSLTIESSLCYTFRGQQETELSNATIILPQAIADGSLTLETPVAVAGLGRLELGTDDDSDNTDQSKEPGSTSFEELKSEYEKKKQQDNTGEGNEGASKAELPAMDAADRYDQDGTTYLTLAPRILNLEKVTDRLAELEDGVMAAVDDTSGSDAELSVEEVLSKLDVSHDLVAS